jgi:formate hydrogenlyase subunit 3/multisubunit Na+/H+ antiporter MnhD subunit
MLTPEEEKFVAYWQEQRLHKKSFLRKFSIALPAVALLAILFFANFLSGWYGKADKELRRHSSLIIVVLVAVIAIVAFVVIFSARQKWEQNEAAYESLVKKMNDNKINES